MQVLQLTPEQIGSLPLDQQRQVLELVILTFYILESTTDELIIS